MPPEHVLDEVEQAQTRLRPELAAARVTARGHWHLTLAFLGDHADLEAAAAALDSLDVEAFTTDLRGVGAFPRPRAARVLWLGVCTGRDDIVAVATAVRDRLGLDDEQPFRPHVTLARFKAPRDVTAITAGEPTDWAATSTWVVHELVLFESTLGREGATHRARARYPLR